MDQIEVLKKMETYINTRVHPFKFDREKYNIDFIYIDLEMEGFEGLEIFKEFRRRIRNKEYEKIHENRIHRSAAMLADRWSFYFHFVQMKA